MMKKRIEGWSLADSIMLATAGAKASKVVAGDSHFRSLDEVIYVG